MKFTIDASSMEALNATGEQIKNEIARLEAEGKKAREKKVKTKQVQKTSKKAVDVLEDAVETYEGLLHLQKSVASFKGALTKKQKREAEARESAIDEQIFEEALAAENQLANATNELEESRTEIHEAYDDVQRLQSDLAAREERLAASRERIPGVFQAAEAANRAQEESQRAILQDSSEPSLIESFKVDQEQAAKAGTLAAERREIHEAFVDVEETRRALEQAQARHEKARKEIAERFAAVERAKAEAERTYARLDARFALVHEAEAKVHDAKADKLDFDAGKGLSKKEQPIRKDIQEQQLAAARKAVAGVLRQGLDKITADGRDQDIYNAQSVAAAIDVSRVAEENARKAAEAKHLAELKAQQGRAAAADTIKVTDFRAQQEGATEEDKRRAEDARQAARNNNISNGQALVAADDVARVASARAGVAKENERDAKIKAQQAAAARRDTIKVGEARYNKVKGEIIQDLPIRSNATQTFKTPGMTDEQVKESQDKLALFPMKDGNATPTVSWVEMRDRINSLMLKKERNDKNLTPEEAYALYFLAHNRDAAPTKEFVDDLIRWAGIAPLERTTPRTTGPAPVQTKTTNNDSQIVPQVDPIKTAVVTTMTDKQIEEAKKRLDDSKKKTDHTMTDEEIEAAKKKMDDDKKKTDEGKGTTPTEKPTEENPKNDEGNGKDGKKHKVVEKVPFFTRIKNSFLVLKFLAFGEQIDDKPESYQNAVLAMGNLRTNYKNQSTEENKQQLKDINSMIMGAKDLTPELNQKLFKKLVRLTRKVDRYIEKHKNNKVTKVETPTSAPILTEEEQVEIGKNVQQIMDEKKAAEESDEQLEAALEALNEEGYSR